MTIIHVHKSPIHDVSLNSQLKILSIDMKCMRIHERMHMRVFVKYFEETPLSLKCFEGCLI